MATPRPGVPFVDLFNVTVVKQLQLLWDRLRGAPEPADDGIRFRRNLRARRYRLYLDSAGQPRVTIPRRGTLAEARRFAEQHRPWIESQLAKFKARRENREHWTEGTEVLYLGEFRPLRFPSQGGTVLLATETIVLPRDVLPGTPQVRRSIEAHLRRVAERELPVLVRELAARHSCVVARVSIRNQRTRWGSCSRRGVISLNWRLIQLPEFVRDYVVLHELMHLREMNHSSRFWGHVETVCPGYRDAEQWLKSHPGLLSAAG